ncbi:MAG: RNA polymerase sigma factor [Saprospiraceae bacterium]|nr:RNA polymerase sigma factor [Saprospiraceae bacterium]
MDDADVIQTYLNTQADLCFTLIYSRYSSKVYAKCIALLKNEVQARDATQEIFMKIFLNLSKFGQRSRFSTWVYSISYNYCIDFLRKQQKKQALFSEEMANPPDISDQEVPDYELLELEVKVLKQVLDRIPVGDKAVLLMKYQDEMSIKEMSSVLNKSESAIKMKIKRAKLKALESKKSLMASIPE